MKRISMGVILISLITFTTSCGALRVAPVETASHKDVPMVEDKDIGKVFLAPGFDFKGYEVLLISTSPGQPVLPKKDIDPEEMQIYFGKQLLKKVAETGIFAMVTDDPSQIPDDQKGRGKILNMSYSLSDLEPGSRAVRYFVGFGAGATKVQVETEISNPQTKELCYKASDRRAGAMGGFGGDSKGFILESLSQIAESQASFIKRISSGGKIEKP